MGGRGASSGFYKLNGKANVYGDEYASVMARLEESRSWPKETEGRRRHLSNH